MEVFIKGIPESLTQNQFEKFIRSPLSDLGIYDWQVQKRPRNQFANLIFLNISDGQRFLDSHGQAKDLSGREYPPASRTNIVCFGVPLSCSLSKKQPDPLALRSLQMESKARPASKRSTGQSQIGSHSGAERRVLKIVSLSCGTWGYHGSKTVFSPYTHWPTRGTLKFVRKRAIISSDQGSRVDIPLTSIVETNTEGLPHPAITLTLNAAPLFFETASSSASAASDLDNIITILGNLGNNRRNYQDPHWTRIPSLNSQHETVAGTCLVYRINLEGSTVDHQMTAMGRTRQVLSPLQQHVEVVEPQKPYKAEMNALLERLEGVNTTRSPASLPFNVKFQLQALVQNAVLPPSTISGLLGDIDAMITRTGPQICAYAIRRLSHELPSRCLQTDFENAGLFAARNILRAAEARVREGGLLPEEMQNLGGRAHIHRVTFTPAGMYLYGPEPVNHNRVLRKYYENHDAFIRVQFCDENGDPIHYSAYWSNDTIYYSRFKKILNEGFHVAGRRYAFLGFSHSSLRAQSCWFMAPFIHDGSLLYDRQLIRGLGDFSRMRCPAKCAARIGQAFSETPIAVTVTEGVAQVIDDIERNGRVFSDGVGTISKILLEKIWAAMPVEGKVKPCVFQIRYSGAKGMISWDPRLTGEKMLLRKSMVKFFAPGSLDIEICDAAYRPLPYFLNQQTIKILEDMGVDESFFFFHQNKELDRLQSTTSSPTRASQFLKAHSIGDIIHLPWFIRQLSKMKISFLHDTFLANVIEMAVMMELRALKYKARIPVKDGYTLRGIMDETGLLQEGQIFCIVEEGGLPKVIAGENLVISRSPALHPGDVRSHGSRDLPSQLSGGDLDGDLYQILFDPKARPKRLFEPADYPREEPIDLGRPVRREDMTDFFITFMATDQLGRIANQHKFLADQRDDGTLDPDCIKLAGLHSTAVDYSKSGIAVDLTKLPRSNHFRPDFMAPGPHVVIEKAKPLNFAAPPESRDDDDDDDEDRPAYRYYESDKVLGKLFRAIDEYKILSTVQSAARAERLHFAQQPQSVLKAVWGNVYQRCQFVKWREHVPRAVGIRDEYESIVHDFAVDYGTSYSQPLSEYEIFIGNIMGRAGAQSKTQRENSQSLRESFRDALRYIVGRILKDEGVESEHALERSVACLAVGLETSNSATVKGPLKEVLVSFGYVAASVCLWELDRRVVVSGDVLTV
ncbi:RNA-directed RNA polymerase [Cladophialophora carrionii]|uniref:RNA-dependent RNA polymerase n=1 Tax=Cladophialophora carrionii TaxID=86049 RepID=A0A1C1CTA6_9EURO|nr:RNA-directed RNA polymerase [Cladophialophora carrionii]